MDQKKEHLNFLDQLRGAAILFVFLHHCVGATYGIYGLEFNGWWPALHQPMSLLVVPAMFGWVGVPVFFVVSGFCIHLSHARSDNGHFATFFTRRFFRIYPPYLIALAIFCIVPTVAWAVDARGQFLPHLLLVQNCAPRYFFGTNRSFWSIAVEVQLYLFYPLLLRLVRIGGWQGAMIVVGAIELAIRSLNAYWIMTRGHPFICAVVNSPFAYWFTWSLGAWAADAYLRGVTIPLYRVPVWLFPIAFLIAALCHPLNSFTFVFAALATTVALRDFLRARVGIGGVMGSQLRFIGTISYSAYLLHQPIVQAVPLILSACHLPLGGIALFLACVLTWFPITLLSYGFHRLIEMPSVDLGSLVLRWFACRKVIATSPS